MAFNSSVFLFIFLPLLLLVVFPLPRHIQNVVLLVASVFFYVWGAGWQVVWIGFVAVASYAGALALNRTRLTSSRFFFAVLLAIALSPLLLLKYLPPLTELGLGPSVLTFVLPLGISFFTFHAVSYLIDVKRGSIAAETRAHDYFLYLFYFPHQIAGPIVRYSEIVDDIKRRPRPETSDVIIGLSRFGWGLAKKALVADPAGTLATAMWESTANGWPLSTAGGWLAAFAFAVQIYFDFSAYTDMAIGLARVFGFHFPENFAAPYASISATEFWRRWHMTLSRWFRDYVYIPLGGSRHGIPREYVALLITFALTSLWHGATLPFLLWGGLWSTALIVERLTGLNKSTAWTLIRRIGMAIFIVASWVPFRAPSLNDTWNVWRAMFSAQGLSISPEVLILVTPTALLSLTLGLLYFMRPRRWRARFFDIVTGVNEGIPRHLWRVAVVGLVSAAVGIVVTFMTTSSPFIYFQF